MNFSTAESSHQFGGCSGTIPGQTSFCFSSFSFQFLQYKLWIDFITIASLSLSWFKNHLHFHFIFLIQINSWFDFKIISGNLRKTLFSTDGLYQIYNYKYWIWIGVDVFILICYMIDKFITKQSSMRFVVNT